ncbi:MAG: aspartate 1-decarboxylase, partial [Flavobacteriales bacterium]|nr:aspartate 1-decarboxylase [Flavobacteriales bacterium]
QVCLNGPAARRVQEGDLIIVIAYAQMTPEEAKVHQPILVFPDTATNRLKG